MKRYVFTLFVLSAHFQLQAQQFEVQDTITVASGFGNYHPQIEPLGNGQPGIIWADNSSKNLFFSRRLNLDQFSEPLQLNPSGTQVQVYNWSGPDLCSEGSNVYVAYHDLGYETGHIYLVKSSDYGATFGDTVRIDDLTDAYAQFPDIAVYNDTLFVAFMSHSTTMSSPPQMVLARSTDGGLTFEPHVDATTWVGGEACDCCQPEIVVDDQRVIIYYRQNATDIRDIKAVVSYDRGVTFTDFYSPDDHNWSINACPSTGPDARIGLNGNLFCTYKTYFSGVSHIYVNEYDLVNDNLIAEVDITMTGETMGGLNYPQIAMDQAVIALVWEGLGSGTDIYFNATTTGASGLDPDNAINVSNISGSQSKPDLCIMNGAFHVVYSELSGAQVKYVRIGSVVSLIESMPESLCLYPNPVSDLLALRLPNIEDQVMTVIVYDLRGQQVKLVSNVAHEENYLLPVGDLEPGSYVLQVITSGGVISEMFVKAD